MATSPPFYVVQFVSRHCPGCWQFFTRTTSSVRPSKRAEVGSWWRSTAVNARERGQGSSQHLVGMALDLTGPGAGEVARQLKGLGWRFIVDEGDHWHAQVFAQNPFPLGELAQAASVTGRLELSGGALRMARTEFRSDPSVIRLARIAQAASSLLGTMPR
jgi:hypothetical protein